jgi:hypothetical protein
VSYQQVSEVSLSRGLMWSNLSIESSGGRSIVLDGVPKSDTERVKVLVDDAVARAKGGIATGPPSATGPTPPPDLADQLRKLADLRDQGILTEAEFATQKAKLLG